MLPPRSAASLTGWHRQGAQLTRTRLGQGLRPRPHRSGRCSKSGADMLQDLPMLASAHTRTMHMDCRLI